MSFESWSVPPELSGIKWANYLKDKPDEGQSILVYIPFSYNQVRVIMKYDPKNRDMIRAWSPIKLPFTIDLKDEDQQTFL